MFVRSDHEKLKELEDEQEELNGSLLALTSHFAQVVIIITSLKLSDMNVLQVHKKDNLLEILATNFIEFCDMEIVIVPSAGELYKKYVSLLGASSSERRGEGEG